MCTSYSYGRHVACDMFLTSATNVDTVLSAPEKPTLTDATRSRPQYASPARFMAACIACLVIAEAVKCTSPQAPATLLHHTQFALQNAIRLVPAW